MTARWATFDCYGTLVDWNAGIGAELGRLFGSIWINRLRERAEPAPTRELPDLTDLADVLDELVPQS
jgi:FMN phosphatase YigB (HAD superfamily)